MFVTLIRRHSLLCLGIWQKIVFLLVVCSEVVTKKSSCRFFTWIFILLFFVTLVMGVCLLSLRGGAWCWGLCYNLIMLKVALFLLQVSHISLSHSFSVSVYKTNSNNQSGPDRNVTSHRIAGQQLFQTLCRSVAEQYNLYKNATKIKNPSHTPPKKTPQKAKKINPNKTRINKKKTTVHSTWLGYTIYCTFITFTPNQFQADAKYICYWMCGIWWEHRKYHQLACSLYSRYCQHL